MEAVLGIPQMFEIDFTGWEVKLIGVAAVMSVLLAKDPISNSLEEYSIRLSKHLANVLLLLSVAHIQK